MSSSIEVFQESVCSFLNGLISHKDMPAKLLKKCKIFVYFCSKYPQDLAQLQNYAKNTAFAEEKESEKKIVSNNFLDASLCKSLSVDSSGQHSNSASTTVIDSSPGSNYSKSQALNLQISSNSTYGRNQQFQQPLPSSLSINNNTGQQDLISSIQNLNSQLQHSASYYQENLYSGTTSKQILSHYGKINDKKEMSLEQKVQYPKEKPYSILKSKSIEAELNSNLIISQKNYDLTPQSYKLGSDKFMQVAPADIKLNLHEYQQRSKQFQNENVSNKLHLNLTSHANSLPSSHEILSPKIKSNNFRYGGMSNKDIKINITPLDINQIPKSGSSPYCSSERLPNLGQINTFNPKALLSKIKLAIYDFKEDSNQIKSLSPPVFEQPPSLALKSIELLNSHSKNIQSDYQPQIHIRENCSLKKQSIYIPKVFKNNMARNILS